MPITHMSLAQIVSQKRHHGEDRFVNPFNSRGHGNFAEVLKWKLFEKNHFSALYEEEEVKPVSIDWKPVQAHQGLSVTYINHACVMIKDVDTCILVDPVFSGLFFIKDFTPLDQNPSQMPRPQQVLITHGHYDHLDLPTLKSFDQDTHFILPLGYGAIKDALAPRRVTRLDWLDEYAENGRAVTLLPCNHWTMRNPLVGPNLSLWGSFLIRTAGGRHIYLSGDTAYFDGFREIGAMAEIDLAIINVGAYEPRWFMKASHMNPADTVKAFQELGARQLMIVHWGTFRLGDEPVFLPPQQIREEMEKAGLLDRLIDIEHGQTVFF